MRKPVAEALHEAASLFAAGRLEEARRACRKLLAKRPDIAEAHLLLAEIHRESGDEPRARESTTRVLKLRPQWSEAHIHLAMGDLLGDFGRYADAEARYRRALELQPALADARYNLAAALSSTGRAEESMAELKALLARDPAQDDARQRLVVLLHQARRLGELESVCREGMAVNPREPFYRQRLGVALWWSGRHEEAIGEQRRAAQLAEPGSTAYSEAKALEASSLLALGRYAEGWEAYRWRSIRTSLSEAHPELIEDPAQITALAGGRRIRIISEQGFGDELFFLRFAAPLRARGHRLIPASGEKLLPLLRPLNDLFEDSGAADLVVAAGDLPLASGTGFAPPLALPVDAARRAAMEQRLRAFGPPPYIGVTWRAGILPEDPKPQGVYWVKEIAPETLATALQAVDARVVILQRRPPAGELRRFAEALDRPVLDLSAVNDYLPDALAVLSILEDYVGVSNTNMHLRAALPDKGARVLVRMPAEWRWGIEGDRTPWFPGFTVYRLALGDEWDGVVGRLRRDLTASP